MIALQESGDKEEYVIRRFREEDLPSVIYINRTCLPENYAPDFFLYHFHEFPEGFLVAEMKGEIVGYIMSRIDRGFSYYFHGMTVNAKGHIISLAVLPHARRKGIAKKLLREAIEAISSKEVEEVYLEVRVSNIPAVNLYKKLGFKIVKRVPGYYADGEDAYVMLLKIAK
ncbi:MAG: ribosomal protein S18-alanine N-acetyltransferase [Candidatus Nezhaarchaeota archaeon]|nr:ribosomal protein S18-alanine N-acetyltransferase [Candidatus Nezhaarchaeota archaeon]MCX8141840.1 ribosomal protein S18-alanine N-acetyltransferase [Candidatus Nezhaarchaeota archaeon]MDW8050379.1 ribosomal protein S18-alanine N-acetyltransferase [Nitrososphaerota archaeon]